MRADAHIAAYHDHLYPVEDDQYAQEHDDVGGLYHNGQRHHHFEYRSPVVYYGPAWYEALSPIING